MTQKPDPRTMSQVELDAYLDALVAAGREDTVEFARAYGVWEERA